jgi:hypothetical protein
VSDRSEQGLDWIGQAGWDGPSQAEEIESAQVAPRQEIRKMAGYEIKLTITTPDGEVHEAAEPLSKRVVDGSPRGAKKAIDEVVQLVAGDVVAEVVAKLGVEG